MSLNLSRANVDNNGCWFEEEGSYICMLSNQEIELFERIRRIRRCGLVAGNISLGLGSKVSKAHARPRLVFPSLVSFFFSLPVNQDIVVSYCSSACLYAVKFPTVMILC